MKLNVKLMRWLKLVKRGKVKLNVKLMRCLRLVKRGEVKLNVKLMRCGMKMMDWKMQDNRERCSWWSNGCGD